MGARTKPLLLTTLFFIIAYKTYMANFHLGTALPEDDEDDEVGTKERRQSLRKKRHYKKDSRFLLDLYTLTFDENESVDEIAATSNRARLVDDDDLMGNAPS